MRKKVVSLGVVAILFLGIKICTSQELTPEQKEHRRKLLLQVMSSEGLKPENCHLKGVVLQGASVSGRMPFVYEYSLETFPVRWEFDDGTLCGMAEHSGVESPVVKNGTLQFKTTGEKAILSWGDFKEDQAPIRLGWPVTEGGEQPEGTAGVMVRMKQSLPESFWYVILRTERGYGQARNCTSEKVTVKGDQWQEIFFKVAASVPITGFLIASDTPGNQVEIDWIRPVPAGGCVAYRKVIELPGPVRWAKISISSYGFYEVFINGKKELRSRPVCKDRQLWNYDLNPKLFHKGKNVIGVRVSGWASGYLLVDGAILCENGTYLRFDTDTETWKVWPGDKSIPSYQALISGNPWAGVDFDDSSWKTCGEPAEQYRVLNNPYKFWFNPSWKGQMMVEPADGRSQPVYGSKEGISLKVSVPYRQAETQEITYELFDEMGDGFHAFDTLVKKGSIPLKKTGLDNSGVLKFSPGELKHNVAYAVVFHFSVNGQEVEKYRYEIAVCGPVEQPVVENPKDYTDGMKLKLVWQVDAAEEQKEGEFISCDGLGQVRESKVIRTPLGRFRTTFTEELLTYGSTGSPCSFISFLYRIQNPGRPHIAIAEYPDDTVRMQEMRVNDWTDYGGVTVLGNDTVDLGKDNHPLTNTIQYHQCLFFPNTTAGTVSFFSFGDPKSWSPEQAARVGKIWIYEVLNDVPMRKIVDAPGEPKWIGQQPEAGPRQVMQSCLSSPLAPYMKRWTICGEIPNFYRIWLLTFINMVKRLRFAGENAYHMGQFMYDAPFFPSEYSDVTPADYSDHSGSLRDYGVLMAKIFEENNLGWFSSIEMCGIHRLKRVCTDYEVARGFPTLGQVNRMGRQETFLGRGTLYPIWYHPEVRKHYEKLMNELIELYGKWKGWKGITLQVNEVLGPTHWSEYGEQFFASYDDYSISLFEKETGVRIPVDTRDPERFSKRYEWLMENAKKEWAAWRCKKMDELYDWLRKRLQETRPDLKLVLYPNQVSLIEKGYDEAADKQKSVYENAINSGLDIKRYLEAKDVVVAYTSYGQRTLERNWRNVWEEDELFSAVSNDGKNGITVRYGWSENQPPRIKEWVWPDYNHAEAWPYPAGEYFAQYWTNIFVRTNPSLILHAIQDCTMWMGRETSMGEFAQAFRSLPAGKYQRLTGNGRDNNVWIAVTQYGKDVYGYIANTQWWKVKVEVSFPSGTEVEDLTTYRPVKGGRWVLEMKPYSIHPFKVRNINVLDAVRGCISEVDNKGQEIVSRMVREAKDLLEKNRGILHQHNMISSLSSIVEGAQKFLEGKDYVRAYETLFSLRYTRAKDMVRETADSPWYVEGWKVSRLFPKTKPLNQIECPSLSDAGMDWKPVVVIPDSNRILSWTRHVNRDGIAFLGAKIFFPETRRWIVKLGRDGACALFMDGKMISAHLVRHNPIREDCDWVEMEIEKGTHEFVVALDTDSGMGWGITFRLEVPRRRLLKLLQFPVVEK